MRKIYTTHLCEHLKIRNSPLLKSQFVFLTNNCFQSTFQFSCILGYHLPNVFTAKIKSKSSQMPAIFARLLHFFLKFIVQSPKEDGVTTENRILLKPLQVLNERSPAQVHSSGSYCRQRLASTYTGPSFIAQGGLNALSQRSKRFMESKLITICPLFLHQVSLSISEA